MTYSDIDDQEISPEALEEVFEHKMLDERPEWELMKQHLHERKIEEAARIFQQQAGELDDIEFMGLVLAVEEVGSEYLGDIASCITSVATLDKMEADLMETIGREMDEESKRIYQDALEKVRTQRDGLDVEEEI